MMLLVLVKLGIFIGTNLKIVCRSTLNIFIAINLEIVFKSLYIVFKNNNGKPLIGIVIKNVVHYHCFNY